MPSDTETAANEEFGNVPRDQKAEVDRFKDEIANFGSNVFRHIVERNHDDWKYSIEISTGPADNRINIKARGDNLKEVLADIATQKKELGV